MIRAMVLAVLMFSGVVVADRGDDPFAPAIGSLHMCQIVKDRVDFYADEIASGDISHPLNYLQQRHNYFEGIFSILKCERFGRELS
jgi:hypothetical protein